jgi:integrase
VRSRATTCAIGLVIYRQGLRVSEACDLRWDDIDLPVHQDDTAPGKVALHDCC